MRITRKVMASKKQVAANRQNASRSTGPRTARGKARASANALRHGLARGPWPANAEVEVDRLANVFAGKNATENHLACATIAAQSTLRILHIRQLRALTVDREFVTTTALAAADLHRLSVDLTRLERYEERAISRRTKAFRHLAMMPNVPDSDD